MKVVFMGTPDFAVPCLDMLIKEHEVVAVFTQPDKPKGRGKKVQMTPVKELAVEHDIPVYQPVRIKKGDSADILREMNPDIIIVIAYGQLLSQEILDIPKHGCVNVHASLLPAYRGSAPINWAIVNGETKSGVTTMFMDIGMDTGDMILKDEVEITETTTAGELYAELMTLGGKTLKNTMDMIEAGTAPREKQDDALACHAPPMNKEMSVIDWSKTAKEINCLIRGFNPWPVAISSYTGLKMKVFKSTVLGEVKKGNPGEVVAVSKEGIDVMTGDGILRLEEIQFPNKKRMTVSQYILGNDVKTGVVLGDENE